MLSREQQQRVWANAYNAALTGLLAARMHEMDRFSANNVRGITEHGTRPQSIRGLEPGLIGKTTLDYLAAERSPV
jgi:hypothetical protein